MKNLHAFVLVLGLMVLLQGQGMAQSMAGQRVERYLVSAYEKNKAGLKETERTIAYLKDKLDEYTYSLNKADRAIMKEKEAAFYLFLDKMDGIMDHKKMVKMVEEVKVKNTITTASIMNGGINSMKEAQECRMVIVFKIIEQELMQAKNEKLVALLKDNGSREDFISIVVNSGRLSEDMDLQSLMLEVDNRLIDYSI